MCTYMLVLIVLCLNGGGFVDIFTGQIHSQNSYEIQLKTIYQTDDKDFLDHSVQT